MRPNSTMHGPSFTVALKVTARLARSFAELLALKSHAFFVAFSLSAFVCICLMYNCPNA